MKEHFQDQGVRKWAGEDLIELQAEPLAALQALVEPYAPCIIKGCEVTEAGDGVYDVAAGLVALRGADKDGNDCVKVVRFDGLTGTALPLRLVLQVSRLVRVYSDNGVKPIAYDYTAEASTGDVGDRTFLEITADGGPRLVDTIGITQKLDREGGEAKAVKVTFNEAAARELPESGNRLGAIVGSVRKWFSDLRALAFKDKVALADLDTDTAEALNSKVDKVTGKKLSSNDFTQALLDKLNGIEPGANKYSLPVASPGVIGGVKLGSPVVQSGSIVGPYSELGRTYPIQENSAGRMVVNVPWRDTIYSHPTGSGNNHIPTGGSAGQLLGWEGSGVAKWVNGPNLKLLCRGLVKFVNSTVVEENKIGEAKVVRNSEGYYYVYIPELPIANIVAFTQSASHNEVIANCTVNKGILVVNVAKANAGNTQSRMDAYFWYHVLEIC